MRLHRGMGMPHHNEERNFTQERGELYSGFQEYLGSLATTFHESAEAIGNGSSLSIDEINEKKQQLYIQRAMLMQAKQEYESRLQEINADEAQYLADMYGVPTAAPAVSDDGYRIPQATTQDSEIEEGREIDSNYDCDML